MTTYETHFVSEVLSERDGLQRLRLSDNSRAYNLTQLAGPVVLGDRVVVNTTAVELGLGTGGWHIVHWNLSNASLNTGSGGHIMKMRYTSLQTDTGSFEESLEESFDDPLLEPADALHSVPVIVCSLHSQMAAAAIAFHHAAPDARLVYVMTDGASLPLAMSDIVAEMREREVVSATVTCGHAFGGDAEAVNVASGLCAAVRVHRADAIIVSMGPGVVGTGTALGTTALEVVDIVAWAHRLGGRPVLALRGSHDDPRPRHQGISHHSTTAVGFLRASLTPVTIAVADGDSALLPDVECDSYDVSAAMSLFDAAPRITTMGRDVRGDPLFFRLSAAAGLVAAHMLQRL